jgi:hypothetical protein
VPAQDEGQLTPAPRTELASSRGNIASIRTIVLVTDGRATHSLLDEFVGTGTAATTARRRAYDQADYALDDDTSVFCVWRDEGSLSDDMADFIGDVLDLDSDIIEEIMDFLGIDDMLENAAAVLSTRPDARAFCQDIVAGGPGETNPGFGEYHNATASGATATNIADAIVDQLDENTPIALVQ